MPKYWGENYFAHGRFPEVGQKQKMEKKRMAHASTHGARKPPGPKEKRKREERKTEQW